MDLGALATRAVLSLGAEVSLRVAARRMVERRVGSAVVLTEDGRPGIITERDLMRALAEGADPDETTVEAFMTPDALTASPSWDLLHAGTSMLRGGFRHLLVMDANGSVAGVVSMRDLVRALLESAGAGPAGSGA